MELFSLGIGNYTEDDVKQGARAFTGWGASTVTTMSSGGSITMRGSRPSWDIRGNFNGDDIIDIILATPGCARFIGSKLFRFFAYEEVDDKLAEGLGSQRFAIIIMNSGRWFARS